MDNQPEVQESPRVSVILVSWNNAAQLRACLQSLEALEERPLLEVLLVDQGSRDDCPRLDAEFTSLHLHRLPRHFGMVKALNIAMRTARGEYFLFLEPPATFPSGSIRKLVGVLEQDSSVTAVCPLARSPEGEVTTRHHPLPLPSELRHALVTGDFPAWRSPELASQFAALDYFQPPIFVVRAWFMRGLRYLDERYGHYWWELEICTQIRKAGKKILLLPEVSATLIPHDDPQKPDFSTFAPLASDRCNGAALWVRKHYGTFEGLKFRLGLFGSALLQALVGLVTLDQPAYRLSLLMGLLTGQKLDGTQATM